MLEKQKTNRNFKLDSEHEEFRESLVEYICELT